MRKKLGAGGSGWVGDNQIPEGDRNPVFCYSLDHSFLDFGGTAQHFLLPFVFILRATTSSCFISTP